MDRLQKKCFIASAGGHLLLASILMVGPSFLSARSRTQTAEVLDFIPSKLLDAAMTGGGNPTPKPPTPAPPQTAVRTAPQPAAPAQPRPEPELAKEVVRETRKPEPEPDSFEPSPKRHRPEISTTLVTRKSNSRTTKTNKTTDSSTSDRQWTDTRQKLASQLSRAAENIRQGTSATDIEEIGPGGGGPAYASYAAWVLTVYDQAWVAPEDATLSDAITKVKVVIASDGAVVSSQIIERSGDAQVDSSVRRALDRVTSIGRPFPDGAKEKQRTYIIPFNLKAKRGIG